jgi:hypothetical protein
MKIKAYLLVMGLAVVSGSCSRTQDREAAKTLSAPLAAIQAHYKDAPVYSLSNYLAAIDCGTGYWAYVAMQGSTASTFLVSIGPTGEVRYVMAEKQNAMDFDPRCASVISAVHVRVVGEMEVHRPGISKEFGACNEIWERMAKILRNEYGLDWKTPKELNPFSCYD